MSAQLLFKMIKSKTEFPLHKAIKVEREDVVFLYLIEMDSQVSSTTPLLRPPAVVSPTQSIESLTPSSSPSTFQLPGKLNELDNNGDLALDLALSRKLESIATTLVDQSGWSLLHKAIQRGRRGRNVVLYLLPCVQEV